MTYQETLDPSGGANLHAFRIPPVVKVVQVRCVPAVAFDRFTQDIGVWWPVDSHSLGHQRVVHVGFEPWIGGRLFERHADGAERTWGSVTAWQPPERVAFTWHVGRDVDTAQDVEVSFIAHDDSTRVTLVHSGWERLPLDAGVTRDEYDGGWNAVFLHAYRKHADAAGGSTIDTSGATP